MPVYNMSSYLKDTFTCINRLEFNENFQFIFIDDCSTDSSKDLIQSFQDRSNLNICFLKNSVNLGYGESCNQGLKMASGKYVSIYEPDDFLDSDFYRRLLDGADPSIDIVKFNGLKLFSSQGTKKIKFRYKHLTSQLFYGKEQPGFWINHPTITNAIYKKSFLVSNGIRFCKGVGSSFQDAQFAVALYAANPKIKIINETKYNYRLHENQSVSNINYASVQGVLSSWSELRKSVIVGKIDHHIRNFVTMQVLRQVYSLFRKNNSDELIELYIKILKDNEVNLSFLPTAIRSQVPYKQLSQMILMLLKLKLKGCIK